MNLEDGTFFGVHAPIAELFGLKPLTIADDAVSALLPYSPRHLNAHGSVGGPAIAALLDFTLAAAARAHSPLAFRAATIDLAIKFLKPAQTDLVAECLCESRGRSICFASGVVYDAQGEKIAIANGSFKLVKV